jgi:hypothetical protein
MLSRRQQQKYEGGNTHDYVIIQRDETHQPGHYCNIFNKKMVIDFFFVADLPISLI